MKCGLDRFSKVLKIFCLKFLLISSAFNLCILAGESKQNSDLLSDFDYLVSQLYLQHCTFVEIGEGICSLFVELALDSGGRRPLRKQMFFGNCLCSEFRRWHLCSRPLTRLRREDCEFQEGTSCPSSSARVHRRLCDVTGMSQWNPQCNCSVPLAGAAQQYLCGFKTCYAAPITETICGPRTVCGTAHCDVGEHGSLYSVRCDRRCRNHRPFCEDPCPPTSLKRSVTSQWAEWKSSSPLGGDCNMKQFETECLNDNCNKEDSDCICEVKMQDGKLKAFRYLITFTDEKNQCDNNAKIHSKLKVRSTGMKGDAKVWDRFIGAASRDDKNSEAVSMFGKPIGFEAYLSSRKNRPEALKEISAGSIEASLQNSANPKLGILQHLVSMVSNRSQLAEKSNVKPNISDKTVQGTNMTSNSSNDKSKLVDQVVKQTATNQTLDSTKPGSTSDKQQVNANSNQVQIDQGVKQTAANQTLDSTKPGSTSDKQQVNANSNQVQIISNNSKSNSNLTDENPKSNSIQTGQTTNSNLNLTGQNQQNNAKQTDKLSEEGHYHYHFTPLPYLNMSMTPMSNTATVKQNNSDLQKIVDMVKKVTHNLDEEVLNDVKTFKARSQIYKMISENENVEQLNSSMGTLAQSNRGKQLFQASIVGHKEISNNSRISTDAAPDPERENVNRLIRFLTSGMKAQSLNENIKDKVMGSQLKTNAANEIMKSSLQTKETKKSKGRLVSNRPKVSIKQEDIKNKERLEGENYSDKQGERMVLGIGGKRDKIKNNAKKNGEGKGIETETKQNGEEKHIETESKLNGEGKNIKTVVTQTGKEKYIETESKLTGEDKSLKTGAKQTGEEKVVEAEAKQNGEGNNIKTAVKQTGEEKDRETESKLIGEEKNMKTAVKQTGEENDIETESKQTGEDRFVETKAKQTHEEKGIEAETKQNGEKKNIDEEGKINIDKIVENPLRGNEKNEHVDSKQEFPLRRILIGENEAQDQEINLAKEQKAELRESGNLKEHIPVQGEQKDYEQLKEDEGQSLYSNQTSKVISQNVKNQGVKSKVEEQSLYSKLTTRDIYQNVKNQGQGVKSKVKDQSSYSKLTTRDIYQNLKDQGVKSKVEEQSLYSNQTSKVINQNVKDQGVKSKVEEQSLYSMPTTRDVYQNVKNRGVKSKRVKKYVTPELINHNSTPKLEFRHQQRVSPVQGNQKDNLNGNKEIKNYESSKQINEVFTHKQGQGVTTQLVFKDSTPKLIQQNLTLKPTDQDLKKQQVVIYAIGKQKENEHATKDVTHYVTTKPVNKDYTLNLKSQVLTTQLVNKDVTPKLINQDLTPKLIYQDHKSQQGAIQTKEKQNNDNVQANKGINPYVTSKLKSQDDKAMLVNKDVTPQLINHNMTPKRFNQDIRNQQVATPVKGKQDVHESEDIKHHVTPMLMNDFAPKLKNQDVTSKLVNKDVTTKLKSQNLIPKLMNPDLKTLGSGVAAQSNPKHNDQGSKEIKYSVTPKIINENITPKIINKDLKTQQGATPAQSNQKNNYQGSQELKKSVTPNLINENITPKLMNKDLKIQEGVFPAQSKQKNEQGKPEMKQSVTSKLVNEDITPKTISQGVTPKPINQDMTPKKIEQKYYPKPIDQEFTPKHKSQDFTPKEVAHKIINQDFTPKLKHQNDDTKLSSNSKISSVNTINSQPTKIFVSENTIKGSSSAISNKPTTPLSHTEQTNKKSPAETDKITTKGLQNDDAVEVVKTNYKGTEKNVEQASQKSLLTGTQTSTNITLNDNTAVNSNLTAGKSIKLQALDTKVKFNDIADIFPTINLNEVTMPSIPTKKRPRPIFLQDDDDDNAIKLGVKSMTTPNILSAIAKKLFNSRSENSLNDPNDPVRMLSDSNPTIELPEEKCSDVKCYDDPEPVLCDLNKVDKDNLDEKMCDALDQVADLKLSGKVDWLEKPEIFNDRDLDKEKKTGGKENKHTLTNKPKLSAGDLKKKK